MSISVYIIFHIFIGLGLIYFYGKLPKTLAVFVSVFLIMSFLYWGNVIVNDAMVALVEQGCHL